MDKRQDIVERLRNRAFEVDDRPVEEIETALLEATQAIVILRDLVGLQNPIILEDAEPQGRA
ncbi:hypothetical protein GCM10007874_50450 [Labrys miyagiensis]|uniref:Uncharacterized protein n=1 Tax=Labrys miyagiensis TaxID=346912 RepID=A0ABQ6CQG8_9HYPH|nr:hypothetical protein [Labrys miyagiensis]GLS22028.1 hypothetical protein GCM10007874_50450 [Labrys miyagiensis]